MVLSLLHICPYAWKNVLLLRIAVLEFQPFDILETLDDTARFLRPTSPWSPIVRSYLL